MGTSSARLFLSLRDLNGPQRIDAYLDVQSIILPLGLQPGAVIQLAHVKTSFTNREDRIYLVETFSEPTVEDHSHPSTLMTSLRVLPQVECKEVPYREERVPKHTLSLLRRVSKSFIWSLFFSEACGRSNNGAVGERNKSLALKKTCMRPGLNSILRLDVCIVKVVYLNIATKTSSSSKMFEKWHNQPCDWQMSCLVDDGTGQATLHLRGRKLVRRTLMMDNTEAYKIENLAQTTGILEYSSARRMQHAQHIFGYLGAGSNGT